MEVIIFSNNTERRTGLKKLTDRIIMDKRLRLMSLHTSAPENPSELEKQIIADKGYLVIMDITGYPDWKNVILRISAKCRRVRFCLISGSDSAAAEAINLMLDICGYVNASSGDILCSLEAVLVRIYGRITTVCGGIMTFGEDGGLKIISFADIYYIETIKQQRRCTIYHKKGTDTMRADISKLIGSLDGRFEITRSSTIANLSAVKEISDGMICFEDGSCCGVSAKRLSVIKRVMRELAAL